MTHVAAYCRVSTDKSDQLQSYENQKCFFTDYINRHEGWHLTDIYADEGITGTSTNKRDSFNRLIHDAEAGAFQLILTKEVSRFSRNILDAIFFTRRLKEFGVGVLFLNDGISTLDPDSELRLSIMASVAQEESRKTSERVKWGQSRQMERGVVFGRSLLGYTVREGKITIEPEGAAIVRQIYSMFVNDHMGTHTIANRLTCMGCTTELGRTVWSSATILKIIKNEKYCGDLVQKKTITKDYLTHKKSINNNPASLIVQRYHHDPIVSRELWDCAQAERRRRTVGKACVENDSVLDQRKHGNKYALSGKIICSVCFSPYVCRTRKRSTGSTYRVWQSTCFHGIRQIREDWLLEQMRHIVAIYSQQVMSALTKLLHPVLNQNDSCVLTELNCIKRNQMKKRKLTDAYVSGDISRDDYGALCEQYRKHVSESALRLSKLYHKTDKSSNCLYNTANVLISGLDMDTEFYLRLIDTISVNDTQIIRLFLHGTTECRTMQYKSFTDINI